MHALPLFYSTPSMPFPYSIPPRACPPLILSHPVDALPLFYPTSCISSPYSIPTHAWPPPILSHLMHGLPLFYPSPCTPFPYSIPAHACHPTILSQPMHTLSLFSPSQHMPPQHSIPAHACSPNFLSHTPWRHVSPLTSAYATFGSTHTEYIIIIIYLAWQFGASLYHFMTYECFLFSFTWTHHMCYTLNPLLNYIYIT